MADLRVTRQVAEVVASDPPVERLLRITCQVAEVLASDPSPERVLRVTRQAIEVMGSDPSTPRRLRVTRQAVEVMASDAPYQGTPVSAESNLAFTQTVSCNHVAGRSAASSLSLVDGASVRQAVGCSASNALTLSDAAGASAVYSVAAVNSLTIATQAAGGVAKVAHATLDFSQQAACSVVRHVSASDNLTLDQATDCVGSFLVSAESALTLGVQAATGTETPATASSSLALGHQASSNLSRSVSASSFLSLVDSATVVVIATVDGSASNALTLVSQASATVVHVADASSVLTLGSQAGNSLNRPVSASSALALSDSAAGLSILTVEVSAESQLWLWDQAGGCNSTKHVSGESVLALGADGHGNRTTQVVATTPIYFTETTLDRTTFEEIEVEHGLFDAADAYVYVDPGPTGNILSFAQRAGVVHVRADGINVSASNALTLSQWAVPTPTGDSASQLTLGHFASAAVGKVAGSALALGQQASRTIERFVTASSALSLRQAVNVVLVEGCVTRLYTPFVGSTDDLKAPPPPSTTVPTLARVAGIQLYWPVDAPTLTVPLRGPELDNKDRLRFQRINRETRGGTLVVFADPIWPKVQQLTLEFNGLEEDEAQSLLTFFAATLGKEVGLRDWENRQWAGVIVSPDEPIIRNGRHNISTALEFEGVPV